MNPIHTTGKPTYAECPDICRVHNLEHSAKLLFAECQKNMHSANKWHSAAYLFAECQPSGTRQRHTLPSASQLTLGKERHVHRQTTRRRPLRWRCFCLPSAYMGTLGNKIFAECLHGDTRQQDLCRVPYSRHSANAVTCTAPASSPRPLRCCHERSHFSTAVTVMLRRVPNWGTRQTYCNAECNGTGTRHLINFAECRLWHSANKYKNFLQQPPNFFLRSHTMWKTSYLNLANYPLCLLYLDYLFDYKNILCIIQIWTAKCCQKCW